jgi:hypothetical protein
MAKPDLDDGWIPYAHELDAALAVADFTKGARIVLKEVFAQLFGPAKAKTANVSPAALAKAVGMRREFIAMGVKELTESKAIERLEDGTFRFNKNYETWLATDTRRRANGTFRLTPEEAAYCRFSPAIAMAYTAGNPFQNQSPARVFPVTVEPKERNQKHTPSVSENTRQRVFPVTQNVSENTRAEVAPPDPPYVNGRGEFENGELRIGGAAPREDPAPEPNRIGTLDDLLAAVAAEFKPKVVGFVKANGPDITAKVAGRYDAYLAALRACSRLREKPDNPHAWCLKVAGRFAAEGIPPEPVAIEPLGRESAPANPYTKLLADMEDD